MRAIRVAVLFYMVLRVGALFARTPLEELGASVDWIMKGGLPVEAGKALVMDTTDVETVKAMKKLCFSDPHCVGFVHRPLSGKFYPKMVNTGFDPRTATYEDRGLIAQGYRWYYIRSRAVQQIRVPAVLSIKKLSQYTGDDMLDASVEETLLLLLQRDIKRLMRLKDLDARRFDDYFPKDYSTRRLQFNLGMNALSAGLTFVGVANKVMNVPDLFEYSRMAVSNTIRYSKFGAWLADYATSMMASTQNLVKLGGKATTLYWSDVSFGELFESYRYVWLAQNSLASATPITLKDLPIRSETCTDAGPIVGFVQKGALFRSLEDRVGSECIRVRLENGVGTEGWLHRKHVAPFGWYQFMGSMHTPDTLPIFRSPQRSALTEQTLEVGEAFTVVEKIHAERNRTWWRLGDGRGYILVSTKIFSVMRGPIVPDSSSLGATASNTDTSSDLQRATSAAKDAYNSAPSVIGRLAVKTGFFIGGFFTGGILWLPSLVFGLTDSAVGASLAGATAWTSVEKTTFLLAALWRFEHRFFTARTKHQQACNVSHGQLPVCKEGEVCLRTSAIESTYLDRKRQEVGYCIQPPWPVLRIGSVCLVDEDCLSSHCSYKEYDQSRILKKRVEAMTGTCQEFGT